MNIQVIITAPKSLKKLKNSFFQAARQGDRDKVRELLEMIDVDSTNYTGWTALMMASVFSNTEVVRLLLANGAEVDSKDEDGRTALMYASREGRKGHKRVVELLLANGADMDSEDTDGYTALMYASRYGNKEIIKLLKEAE